MNNTNSARTLKEVGAHEALKDLIKPKEMTEGQTIEGIYEGSFLAGKGKKKKGTIHKIRLEDGLYGLGGVSMLNKRLGRMPVGAFVRVTFVGKEEIKGNHEFAGELSYKFKVESDSDPLTTAAAPTEADLDIEQYDGDDADTL